MTKPAYREIKVEEIPMITIQDNIKIKVICGKIDNTIGPVKNLSVDCEYLDIFLPKNSSYIYKVENDFKIFTYVIEGSGYFDNKKSELINKENVILYENGQDIIITSTNESLHILLISGKPINKSIAWGGPIVMNTEKKLNLAFEEYQNGKFIK